MDSTSGQGNLASVPAEVDRWNWGAFLLHWIWGIGNNTLIALLMFVPFVNIVMPFVLGAKGNARAWRNNKWESVEHFQSVQRKWAKWAVIVYLLIILSFAGIFFAVMAMMKSSEAYKLAVATVQENQEVSTYLGKPISTGMPNGSTEESGSSGSANLSFSVEGPKGKGTVYVEAQKVLGQWKISNEVFEEDGSGQRIELTK